MMMFRISLKQLAALLTTALMLVGGLAMADPSTPPPPSVSTLDSAVIPVKPLTTEEIGALVTELRQAGAAMTEGGLVPALGVAMVSRDKVWMADGFGVTDANGGTAVDANTAFRLASVSKTFTAGLMAVLVQDRFVEWSTPLATYLPGVRFQDPNTAAELTLEQLLSHRTGLPHHTFDLRIEANEEVHQLVDELSTVTPKCRPGDCYAYQNVAFSLAGVVAEAATGDFIDVLMTRRLFIPLGMRHTTVGREALMSEASWARPHVRRSGRWRAVDPLPTYYRLPAAAGVNASPADMAIWLQTLLGAHPDVLSNDALAQIAESRVETPTEIRGSGWRQTRIRQAGYGLGVRVYDYSGHRMIFHAGAVQGYRAILGFLPDQDFGIIVFWNSESGLPSGLFPMAIDRRLRLPTRDWANLQQLVKGKRRAGG